MGVNYRLVECGFISNSGDRKKFIEHMDELADGILAAFGIESNGAKVEEDEEPEDEPEKETWQTAYGDPEWFGPKMAREWQRQLGTTADGVISGQPTSNKQYFWAVSGGVTYGSSGSDAVLALQKGLKAAGYDPNGLDRYYGKGCIKALQRCSRPRLLRRQDRRLPRPRDERGHVQGARGGRLQEALGLSL